MNDKVILTPGQKALRINLDNTIYGSFVEIGAGQEVARIFLKLDPHQELLQKQCQPMIEIFQMLYMVKKNMVDMFAKID